MFVLGPVVIGKGQRQWPSVDEALEWRIRARRGPLLSKIRGDSPLSLEKHLRGKRATARAWARGNFPSHFDSPHRMRGLKGRLNQGGRDCRLRPLSMPGVEEQTKEDPSRFGTGLKPEGQGT